MTRQLELPPRSTGRRELLCRTEYFPIDRASAVQYRLIRLCARLIALGLDELTIERTLRHEKVQSSDRAWLDVWDRYVLDGSSPVHALIRLFVLNLPEAPDRLAAVLTTDELSLLHEFGLLAPTGDGRLLSPVSLCPSGSLLLATDRADEASADDALVAGRVMSLGGDSQGLARLVASTSGDTALDLCTGSGVVALTAARRHREVVGVDVNPRALNFARFNAIWNGIDNCTFVQSDLYAELGDRSFDTISANPPFVPTAGERVLLFRDGGRGGEEVLARILEGAPRRLHRGGRCLVTTDLVEHEHVDYPAKLRGWLGATGSQVVVLRGPATGPCQYAIDHHARSADRTAMMRWIDAYRAERITAIAHGHIAVRHVGDGPTRVVTLPLASVATRAAAEPGVVDDMLARLASLGEHGLDRLDLARAFTAGRVRLEPEQGAFPGYELPYVLARSLWARGGPLRLAAVESYLRAAGIILDARRRDELHETLGALFVAGYLRPAAPAA